MRYGFYFFILDTVLGHCFVLLVSRVPHYCLFICQIEGESQVDEHERPGVIISNHVSYVDILYHMSSSFPSFVAKVGSVNIFHYE